MRVYVTDGLESRVLDEKHEAIHYDLPVHNAVGNNLRRGRHLAGHGHRKCLLLCTHYQSTAE